MLLDYAENPRPAPSSEEGIRVAGLLNLKKLLEQLGTPVAQSTLDTIRRGVKADPKEFYRSDRLFLDPRGELMRDTGPTYVARPLSTYSTSQGMRDNAQTLRDFLRDTEVADAFGSRLDDIKIGLANLPGTERGRYARPQYDVADDGTKTLEKPGYLAISANLPPSEIPVVFEHEIQHGFQGLLDMPRGTSPGNMGGPLWDFLMDTGQVRPAQKARIDSLAMGAGVSPEYMRYYATKGEAEARAAASRYMAGAYDADQMPIPEEYLWTYKGGPNLSQNMLFDIPASAEADFKKWWTSRP